MNSPVVDEEYVAEILEAANPHEFSSQEQFRTFFKSDLAAGWWLEVEEAWKRYSAGKP